MKLSSAKYDFQYHEKRRLFQKEFKQVSEIEFFHSLPEGFRHRAEFAIKGNFGSKQYVMTIDGKREQIDSFPIASTKIQELMHQLLGQINACKTLSEKLFQVEFQTSRNQDSMISLIYHRKLDESWENAARHLNKKLQATIIGRSRKQKLSYGNDYVIETYKSFKSKYSLRLYEQCFSQTNPEICEKMLSWVEKNLIFSDDDVVELHCGLGTFTMLLSKVFRKVLATENSRPSFAGLKENLRLNKCFNVNVARLSGHETLQAISNERSFNRLGGIDISEFKFNTIFLDPPREGLDESTLSYLNRFERVIYLSCGFESFKRDLQIMSKTHFVRKLAMFDQFPYTEHIESGAILQKK